MKKFLVLIIVPLVLFLSGCQYTKREMSDIKYEKARILQLSYVPQSIEHTTKMEPVYGMNGNISWTVVPDTEVHPEQWVVVMRCDHGKKFGIENKEIYQKCKVGEEVTLAFVEEREYTYENNEKIDTGRLVDYHTREVIFSDNSGVFR